jgi:hypothetical protein
VVPVVTAAVDCPGHAAGVVDLLQAVPRGRGSLARTVVPAVVGASEEATVAVVRRVRELDGIANDEERVTAAVAEVLGTPMVGKRGPIRQISYPVRSGDDTATIEVDLVAWKETPLRQLLRSREFERETLAQILQATCEQLDIWPARPHSPAPPAS